MQDELTILRGDSANGYTLTVYPDTFLRDTTREEFHMCAEELHIEADSVSDALQRAYDHVAAKHCALCDIREDVKLSDIDDILMDERESIMIFTMTQIDKYAERRGIVLNDTTIFYN